MNKYILLFIFAGILLTSPPVFGAEFPAIYKNVDVSLRFGRTGNFKLFGYSSPNALVRIESSGLQDSTFSRADGYFEFTDLLIPVNPADLCLSSQDQFGRLTPSICIPPIPYQSSNDIGPILLPPTISLDKNDYFVSDQVLLTGQAIPNSPVTISFFNNKSSILAKAQYVIDHISPVGPVDAYSFPPISTKSDDKGNFSFQLPSASVASFRMFTQTVYDSQPSPRSITLLLRVLPIWYIIVEFLTLIFNIIKNNLFNSSLILELVILLIYCYKRFTHPLILHKNMILAKRRSSELMVIAQNDIVPYVKTNSLIKLK